MTRLLAEVGERRRPHALRVAAERGKLQIKREDLVLGERVLQLERVHDLAQLGCPRMARGGLIPIGLGDEAGDLHGERRAARDDPAVADELEARADECTRVDAAVGIEAAVLERRQHGEVARIDGVRLDGQPPVARPGGERAQQGIVAVEDGGGNLGNIGEAGRGEGLDRDVEGGEGSGGKGESGEEEGGNCAPRYCSQIRVIPAQAGTRNGPPRAI